jgi:hypothetical protein
LDTVPAETPANLASCFWFAAMFQILNDRAVNSGGIPCAGPVAWVTGFEFELAGAKVSA